MATTNYGGGVVPTGAVADWTQPQQAALTAINQGYGGSTYGTGAQTAYNSALAQSPNANTSFDQSQGYYDQAGQYLANSQQPLTADQYNQSVSMFMNPYQQQVVQQTSDEIQRNARISESQANSAASNMGAFGGDRDAIRLAELDRNTGQQVANSAGQLNYQGYTDAANNALGLYQTETSNALQGASTAGGLGNTTYNNGMSALQNLQALSTQGMQGDQQAFDNYYQAANYQLGAGNQIQSQNQSVLDAINANTTGSAEWLNSQLSPYLGASTSTSSGSQSSGVGQAVGTGLVGYSLLSDARTKHGIEYVGVKNGHNIYEFSYHGSHNRYRGVLAHEVEHVPDAVHQVDGIKRVDYSKLGVEMEQVA